MEGFLNGLASHHVLSCCSLAYQIIAYQGTFLTHLDLLLTSDIAIGKQQFVRWDPLALEALSKSGYS